MPFETVVQLSQVATLVFFIVLFFAVVTYALWPSNKARFEHAARIPMQRDQDTDLTRGLE